MPTSYLSFTYITLDENYDYNLQPAHLLPFFSKDYRKFIADGQCGTNIYFSLIDKDGFICDDDNFIKRHQPILKRIADHFDTGTPLGNPLYRFIFQLDLVVSDAEALFNKNKFAELRKHFVVARRDSLPFEQCSIEKGAWNIGQFYPCVTGQNNPDLNSEDERDEALEMGPSCSLW